MHWLAPALQAPCGEAEKQSPSCAGRSALKTRVDALVSRASTSVRRKQDVGGRDKPGYDDFNLSLANSGVTSRQRDPGMSQALIRATDYGSLEFTPRHARACPHRR